MQTGGLSFADRARRPAAPKQAPGRRPIGSSRPGNSGTGPRQPPRRNQPPRGMQYQIGPPRQVPPQQQQPRQPAPWNPEQMLDRSKCEIFCKVRKVYSGDQVRLEYASPDKRRPSINFLLILDYVVSRRVSRNPLDTEEEAFGFEAREFLRKFLNGAVVRCTWNPNKSQPKKRKSPNLDDALQELKMQKGPNEDLRLARVFGELKCLRDNPKQRYSEAVYRDENNWIDVATLMCSLGWARTKRVSEKEQSPLWQACKAAEENAKTQQLGLHAVLRPGDIKKHTRHLEWDPSIEDLFERFKNQPIKGIVEDVREGSTIRCEIYMPTDDTEIVSNMIWVCLSGIQSEKMPKPKKTQESEYNERKRRGDRVGKFVLKTPPPLAVEAKAHVERRLLHQDVTITLQNFSRKENKVWGTITLGPHDIASYLLRQGLAWIVPYSLPEANRERYYKDVQIAEQKKVGRYAGSDASKRKKSSAPESSWIVTQVYSGDTVYISRGTQKKADGSTSEGKRCYLAHIKAPRDNRQSGEGPEPWAWEAKEFTRQALIGKAIQVKTIYTKQFAPRPGEKSAPLTEFITISYDSNKDIAHELVKNGLAELIRTSETSRADNYFQLEEANEAASKAGLNMFGDRDKYRLPKTIDLTLPKFPATMTRKRDQKKQEIRTKSRVLMKNLGLNDNIDIGGRRMDGPQVDRTKVRKTSGALPAVVEYVFGATRMKVRLKFEDKLYLVILNLSGIRGQRGQDLTQKQKEIQAKADEWVRRRVQQQENIFVEIESLDKNSNFVGHVHLGPGRGATNLSVKLLEEGWVKIFPIAARRSRYKTALEKAENGAKDARAGLWEDYVEIDHTQVDEDNKSDPTKAAGPKPPTQHKMQGTKNKANVTYVESATELFVVLTGEPEYDQAYKEVTEYMRSVNPSVNNFIKGLEFKHGDLVAGLFSGAYYRCRISSIRNRDKVHNVRFIDFGNRGPLKEAEILPLERYDKNSNVIAGEKIKRIDALAKRCRLAGLKPPPQKSVDYCNAAGMFFAQQAHGEVELEILQVTKNRKFEVYEVELKKDGVNLNELMVEQGWCRVDERNYSMWGGGRDQRENKFPARHKRLQDLQKEAQANHRGMYQYGNVDSEDED